MTTWDCTKCGEQIEVPQELAGKAITCAHCGSQQITPRRRDQEEGQQAKRAKPPKPATGRRQPPASTFELAESVVMRWKEGEIPVVRVYVVNQPDGLFKTVSWAVFVALVGWSLIVSLCACILNG